MGISNRIPKWDKILPVYGVIVLILYSWTLLHFFWKFPSWLYFLKANEILASLAYSLVTNLLESLFVIASLILFSLILPKKWFFEVFVARAVSLVVPGLGFIVYLAMQFQTKEDYPSDILKFSPLVALGIFLFAFLTGRVSFLRRTVEFLADRATIFIYISIPVSLIALAIILIRLIF